MTLYIYCPCGALESIVDALTNATLFNYDTAGHLTNTIYADGYSVARQVDALGRTILQTDSAGISITNWFNNQGLRYAISNAAGNVKTLTFDLEDHATNSRSNSGQASTSIHHLS